ncbi:MAG: TrmB family transcriptional regulator [Halobacteriaceae archaeon]
MTRHIAQSRSRSACLPGGLESPTAKLVCLYLDAHGAATPGELASALEMRRLTLFGVLRTLTDRGVVAREGDRFALA